MKEDILEQVVDEYLQHKGYFTIHNVRFKPDAKHVDFVSNQDSVTSDVDVVGLHPLLKGPERVWVVSCKAWQEGFDTKAQMKALNAPGQKGKRHRSKSFREIWIPKWSEAFRSKIAEVTGEARFRYSIAVTLLKGEPKVFTAHPQVIRNLDGNAMTFLTLEQMWTDVMSSINTTPASSSIGRLAQLLKAAGLGK